MSSGPEAVRPRIAKREIVAEFDPVAMRAPFLLRCGAIAFDYMIIVIWPVLGLLVGRSMGVDGAKLLAGELNNISWLIAFLVGLSNMVLLPVATGQSLGKMLAGLRIVDSSGARLGTYPMIFRQVFGYLLTFGTLGAGFLVSALSARGRALHDLLSGSQVVYGNSKIAS